MLEFNFTLVFFAISFLIFIYLLNLTLFKPVGIIVEKRNNLIESDLTKSKNCSLEAEKTFEEYIIQIKNTRKEAMQIVEESTNKAMQAKKIKVSDLSTLLNEEKNQALKNIENEHKKAVNELNGKIQAITDLITNKVLGEKNLVRN